MNEQNDFSGQYSGGYPQNNPGNYSGYPNNNPNGDPNGFQINSQNVYQGNGQNGYPGGYQGGYQASYTNGYPNNYPGGFQPQWQDPFTIAAIKTAAIKNEKHDIRKLSMRAAYCVIAFIGLQYLSVIILSLFGLYPLYESSEPFSQLFDTLSYLLSAFLPFFVLYRTMKPHERLECTKFNAPIKKSMVLPAVIIGLLICSIGNIVTNYFVAFLESNGFEILGGTYETPTTISSFIMSIFNIAVIPALVEEFAFRGTIMQPLRRYGDTFAVIMSSVVFALMHGNLVQIPFAFIAGLGIGYFTISTGSMWVGVIIHFINNLHSVVLTYLLEKYPTFAENYYILFEVAIFVAGIVCLAIYIFVYKEKYKFHKNNLLLSGGQKTASYIFTVPMIIAFIIIVLETASLVKYVG